MKRTNKNSGNNQSVLTVTLTVLLAGKKNEEKNTLIKVIQHF